MAAWRGMAAPKGIPEDVEARLVAALKKVYDSQGVQGLHGSRGFGVIYLPPAEFAKFMEKSSNDLGATMKAVGHRQVTRVSASSGASPAISRRSPRPHSRDRPMKVNDAVIGACLIALAARDRSSHIQGFPLIPGQKYGPALFPGVIAVGLDRLRRCCSSRAACAQGAPLVALARWTAQAAAGRRTSLAICAVARVLHRRRRDRSASSRPRSLLPASRCSSSSACGVLPAVVVAVVATLVIHTLFYKLLRVPLPWGVLEPVPSGDAWTPIADRVRAGVRALYDPAVILASAVFGLFVGAIPGLTATMATALLVPVTFFMPPVPAIAAIVTATAMAIFAGDIPGALLRIPGHAGVGRLHRRGLRDDAEGPGRDSRSAPASCSR